MRTPECVREREVVEAVTSGRRPNQYDQELEAHVSICRICKDVVLVARSLQDDYASASYEARLPAPGIVWWRAELRARQEAVRTATRPIKVVEALAGACAAAVAFALIRRVDITALSTFILEHSLPISLALGVLVVLTPVAVYFALSDE